MKNRFLLFTIIFISINQCFAQLDCGEHCYENLQWQCLGPFHDSSQIKNQNFGYVKCIKANPNNDSTDIYIGTKSNGLWHTINGGATWKCITDNYKKNIGGINDVFVDFNLPNRKIIVGTGSGNEWIESASASILISNNDGGNWHTAHFNENSGYIFNPVIEKLIKDENNNNTYYASADGAIWKSIDGCETFNKIFPVTEDHKKIFNRQYQPFTNMELDATSNILFLNNNYTHHYENSSDHVFNPTFIMLSNIQNQASKIVAQNLSPLLSKTIMQRNDDLCVGMKIKKCSADNNILHIFKNYANSPKNEIIINYNIEKQIFEKIIEPILPPERFDAEKFVGLQCNSKNFKIHYLTGITLNKSIDSCQSFTPLYTYGDGANNIPHPDIRSIEIFNSSIDGLNDHILLGTDGGLSYSNNGGKSFRNLNGTYLPITEFYGFDVSTFDGKISAGSQDNSIMSLNAKRNKWIININGDGYDVEYTKHKKDFAYGEYNGAVLQTSTNGITPFYGSSFLNHNGQTNPSKNIKTTINGNVYFGGGNSIYKLKYNSKNWQDIKVPNIGNFVFTFDVCQSNEQIMYAANTWNLPTNCILKTTDGGANWMDITSKVKFEMPQNFAVSNYRILKIYCSQYNENEVWLGLGFYSDYVNICNGYNRIIYSRNGGETWQDDSYGLPTNGVNDLVLIEGTNDAMFASTNEGIYFRSSNNGKWKLYGTGMPYCFNSELKIDYCNDNLLVSTYGRGIWQVPLPNDISYSKHNYTLNDVVNFNDSTRDYIINRNIELKSNEKLFINAPFYIAKNRNIICTDPNQIIIGNKGKLFNGCDENYYPIKIIALKKKWWRKR